MSVDQSSAAGTQPSRRKQLMWWTVLALCLATITVLSSAWFGENTTKPVFKRVLSDLNIHMRPSQVQRTHTGIRKAAHFIEFFILSCVTYWAIRRGRPPRWRWQWSLGALSLAVLYALLDEWHQSFLIERTGTLRDSGIDSLGAVAAQLVIALRAGAARLRRRHLAGDRPPVL